MNTGWGGGGGGARGKREGFGQGGTRKTLLDERRMDFAQKDADGASDNSVRNPIGYHENIRISGSTKAGYS